MNILKNLFQEISILFVGYWDWIRQIFSQNKTKIYSLILFIILVLPGLIMPTIKQPITELPSLPSFGSDKNQFAVPDLSFLTPKENIATPKLSANLFEAKIGMNTPEQVKTTLGIKSDFNKLSENIIQKNKLAFEGKISWDDTLSNSVASDKFGVGSNIKISYKDKTTLKIIAKQRILGEDNILLVDKETFVELGGDPKTQKSILANILEQ